MNAGVPAGASIAELVAEGTARLANLGSLARLEAEVLLAHALDRPRSHLITWPEKVPDTREQGHYRALMTARADGTPVAYLTGQREFWSLELTVTPRTLIPRPETERLVELALERIPPGALGRVADLGTGSGAIALALAHERPGLEILATDRDPEAVDIARANATRHGLANVAFAIADWCAPLTPDSFLAIVCNPPYIAPADPHLEQGDLRFEPRRALVSADNGLADLRTLATTALPCLIPGGLLLLEHGYDQAEAVVALLVDAGYRDVRDERDHAGQPRVACARVP